MLNQLFYQGMLSSFCFQGKYRLTAKTWTKDTFVDKDKVSVAQLDSSHSWLFSHPVKPPLPRKRNITWNSVVLQFSIMLQGNFTSVRHERYITIMKAIENSILLDYKKQQVKVRAKSAFPLFLPNYNEFLTYIETEGTTIWVYCCLYS